MRVRAKPRPVRHRIRWRFGSPASVTLVSSSKSPLICVSDSNCSSPASLILVPASERLVSLRPPEVGKPRVRDAGASEPEVGK